MTVFLTIKQIENEYKINRKHIDRAIHSKELPAYQFGNKTKMVKRKDLDKWIETYKYTGPVPLVKYNSFMRQ